MKNTNQMNHTHSLVHFTKSHICIINKSNFASQFLITLVITLFAVYIHMPFSLKIKLLTDQQDILCCLLIYTFIVFIDLLIACCFSCVLPFFIFFISIMIY